MKTKSLLLLLLLLSGCAITSRYRCRTWQNEGLIMSTLDSCSRCVETLGSGNIDMIRGCAVGMDAARLLEHNQKASFVPTNP